MNFISAKITRNVLNAENNFLVDCTFSEAISISVTIRANGFATTIWQVNASRSRTRPKTSLTWEATQLVEDLLNASSSTSKCRSLSSDTMRRSCSNIRSCTTSWCWKDSCISCTTAFATQSTWIRHSQKGWTTAWKETFSASKIYSTSTTAMRQVRSTRTLRFFSATFTNARYVKPEREDCAISATILLKYLLSSWEIHTLASTAEISTIDDASRTIFAPAKDSDLVYKLYHWSIEQINIYYNRKWKQNITRKSIKQN